MQDIAGKDIRTVVMHMSDVEFVDSAAMGMMLLALDEAENQRKELIIRGATGQVKKMFEMARFNTLFTMQQAS